MIEEEALPGPMMLMAQIVLAIPASPARVAAFHDRENPAVEVRADIAADGTPIRCALTYNRADLPGVQDICDVVMQSQFNPARDEEGKSVAAVYTGWYQKRRAKWVPTRTPEWNQRELTITVNKLPKGVTDFSTVPLRVVANVEGAVEACEVALPRLEASVASFFCRQARAVPLMPVRDRAGSAVRSAQLLRVRVTSDAMLRNIARRIGR